MVESIPAVIKANANADEVAEIEEKFKEFGAVFNMK